MGLSMPRWKKGPPSGQWISTSNEDDGLKYDEDKC